MNGVNNRFMSNAKSSLLRVITSPGRVSPIRKVPSHIKCPPRPPGSSAFEKISPQELFDTDDKIARIVRTCALAKKLLDYCGSLIKTNITTEDLDAAAHEFAIKNDSYPSPLLYHGFPKSICTSVNNILCHGIPDDTRLLDGDIINVDVTLYKEGVHGDCSATFFVGNSHDEKIIKLVRYAELARDNAIKICKPGVPFAKIAESIYQTCIEGNFKSYAELTGHGIGYNFHTYPEVPQWVIPNGMVRLEKSANILMQPGMVFTIEPIITFPEAGTLDMWSDGWTIVDENNAWNAQFEHTIIITQDGHRILTS